MSDQTARTREFTILPTDAELLENLPERSRIVLAYSNDGWSYQRIAEEIRRPVGTVKSRINRARLKIIAMREQSAGAA